MIQSFGSHPADDREDRVEFVQLFTLRRSAFKGRPGCRQATVSILSLHARVTKADQQQPVCFQSISHGQIPSRTRRTMQVLHNSQQPLLLLLLLNTSKDRMACMLELKTRHRLEQNYYSGRRASCAEV